MNLVYFGSDLSLPIFEYLSDSSSHRVLALYTHRDPAAGDCDEKLTQAAKRRGVAVTRAQMDEVAARDYFQNRDCALFFSAEYGRKIPVLPLAQFRGVNVHNSLLPEGRGYYPVEMRLYKEFDYGGVTLHKLAREIDRGDILLQERFAITPQDDVRLLYGRCVAAALELVKRLLGAFERYWAQARPQDEADASWWRAPQMEELTIGPALTLAQIRHKFRAFGPLTQLLLDGKRYRVKAVSCYPAGESVPDAQATQAVFRDALLFRAADGIVTVRCQREAL